jgi:hypothetical protein
VPVGGRGHRRSGIQHALPDRREPRFQAQVRRLAARPVWRAYQRIADEVRDLPRRNQTSEPAIRLGPRWRWPGTRTVHGRAVGLANLIRDSLSYRGSRGGTRCGHGNGGRRALDQIIDMNHALAKLARTVDWRFLERRFGEVYTDDPGHPPLPTRLMAGLAILKHTYDLSDEVLCERWVENPYYQYFCGEEFFQHRLVFDRSSMTRWRNRMGEERLQALLQESLSIATKTEAIKPSELSRVIVDTTLQPKNVMFPTDARLMNRAREKLVRLAKHCGVVLRQSYARLGKFALIQHQRYAHAKQFKRANRMLKMRTYLGRVIRDIIPGFGRCDSVLKSWSWT